MSASGCVEAPSLIPSRLATSVRYSTRRLAWPQFFLCLWSPPVKSLWAAASPQSIWCPVEISKPVCISPRYRTTLDPVSKKLCQLVDPVINVSSTLRRVPWKATCQMEPAERLGRQSRAIPIEGRFQKTFPHFRRILRNGVHLGVRSRRYKHSSIFSSSARTVPTHKRNLDVSPWSDVMSAVSSSSRARPTC